MKSNSSGRRSRSSRRRRKRKRRNSRQQERMTGAAVVASCQSCLEDNWMREGQRALASASPCLPFTLRRHPHPVSACVSLAHPSPLSVAAV
ncbi:hypothetical protein E2C01_070039 [Portunus trituberculatus]|uniref:Uncharacterized protein n=1 Tax=Portunus trituberculatus TaxID=210409 RepID=A0A5B7I123_PORTR|nr:hypothetical protein [Portunus trituberculatus]